MSEKEMPIFTLCANDKDAATLIWLWGTLKELNQEKELADMARMKVQEFLKWGHENGFPASGLGTATLAGVLELIKTINYYNKTNDVKTQNKATDNEIVRNFLAHTKFEEE